MIKTEKVYKFVTEGELEKLHSTNVTCKLSPTVTYSHSAHEAAYDAYMTGSSLFDRKSL